MVCDAIYQAAAFWAAWKSSPSLRATMARWVTAPLRFLVNDRHCNAAFRQGIHELGNTFGQMLPDSNTSREVGSILVAHPGRNCG